jgi:uncharacterized protein
MDYLPRIVDGVMKDLLAEVSAILVVGPRACGKTTTAKQFARSNLRLDRADEAAAARADVDFALAVPSADEPVLVDEWQFVPEILGAVKRAVDDDNRPARFLLTGSASADLGPSGWAMTGRVIKVKMWGLTEREVAGFARASSIIDVLFAGQGDAIGVSADAPDVRGYVERALRGMLPSVALATSEQVRQRRLAAYLDQITLRDVADLGDRRDPRRIRLYLAAIAANTAGVLEHKTMYDAAGIDRRTAAVYDSLLEGLFVTEQIPSWSSNRLNRLTRASKRYLVDPSFMGPLLGIDARSVVRSGDLLGRVIDTYVAAQLRAELEVCLPGVTMCHLRQENGSHEIDLILEAPDGRIVAIEVKAGSAPDLADARHLIWMRDKLGDQFVAGAVFHTGRRPFKLSDKVFALPIATIWNTTLL